MPDAIVDRLRKPREDVRVADTVLVLDALARERGIPTPALESPLLPR